MNFTLEDRYDMNSSSSHADDQRSLSFITGLAAAKFIEVGKEGVDADHD